MVEAIHLQLLLAAFAGWVTRQQAQVISYPIEENRVLKEQLVARGRSLRLTDDQRRRLAAKGQPLGHKLLSRVATIVTPDTIMAWYRRLITSKWTYPRAKVGRPGVMKEIRTLIVRMAEENPSWGYCRIQGGLKSLDHQVARSTIAKVLKEHGIAPAPGRASSWRTFIRSHAAVIAAADFFATEVWTARGLVTHYTLFVIDIATRRAHIAGTTTSPNSVWMAQMARNLTDYVDGFLKGKRYLIVDRDALFADRFKAILRSSGTKIVRTSIQAPNMNAFAERFVLSIKSECLDRMILVGGDSLDRAIREFLIHYHAERPHQGLENALIASGPMLSEGRVEVRDRLGGLLKYYYRRAA
jgi:transposase InsO family protein